MANEAFGEAINLELPAPLSAAHGISVKKSIVVVVLHVAGVTACLDPLPDVL
jgi:hypothetical protein